MTPVSTSGVRLSRQLAESLVEKKGLSYGGGVGSIGVAQQKHGRTLKGASVDRGEVSCVSGQLEHSRVQGQRRGRKGMTGSQKLP